jgi:hypothetical protein
MNTSQTGSAIIIFPTETAMSHKSRNLVAAEKPMSLNKEATGLASR